MNRTETGQAIRRQIGSVTAMAFWSFAFASLKSKGVNRAAAEAYRDGRLSEIPPKLLAALEESSYGPGDLDDFIDEVDYR